MTRVMIVDDQHAPRGGWSYLIKRNVRDIDSVVRAIRGAAWGMLVVDPTLTEMLKPKGELLARIGHPDEGEEPGKFIAPHGIGVDSHGDIYVGEVSFTIRGSKMDPPKELRSLSKLRKVS